MTHLIEIVKIAEKIDIVKIFSALRYISGLISRKRFSFLILFIDCNKKQINPHLFTLFRNFYLDLHFTNDLTNFILFFISHRICNIILGRK